MACIRHKRKIPCVTQEPSSTLATPREPLRACDAKSPARIEALFACQFIALLCCCLIERELRDAMTHQQITDLPLYPEDRSCTAPTATRVFDHLAPIQRHHLTRDRHTVQTFEPQLTPLQAQLLDLLAVPASAYTSQP